MSLVTAARGYRHEDQPVRKPHRVKRAGRSAAAACFLGLHGSIGLQFRTRAPSSRATCGSLAVSGLASSAGIHVNWPARTIVSLRGSGCTVCARPVETYLKEIRRTCDLDHGIRALNTSIARRSSTRQRDGQRDTPLILLPGVLGRERHPFRWRPRTRGKGGSFAFSEAAKSI